MKINMNCLKNMLDTYNCDTIILEARFYSYGWRILSSTRSAKQATGSQYNINYICHTIKYKREPFKLKLNLGAFLATNYIHSQLS